MPRKAAGKSEKQKLQECRGFTVTFEGNEANIQRIAALLLFADHLSPQFTEPVKPMPWEDPTDPRFNQPPVLEIDWNAVRNSIMKHLEKFVEKHGQEEVKKLLQSFGVERIRDLSEDQMLELQRLLAAEAKTAHE